MPRALSVVSLLACLAGCSEISSTVIGIDLADAGSDGRTPPLGIDACDFEARAEEFRMQFEKDGGVVIPAICNHPQYRWELGCPAREALEYLYDCLSPASGLLNNLGDQ
ncbi:MAG: hypothetical protein ABW352_08475 [Polyangiales bacterium]